MISYSILKFFRSRIEKVNYRQKEKQVLDDILGKGYDKRIRPSGKNDTGKLFCHYQSYPLPWAIFIVLGIIVSQDSVDNFLG